jgi:hypothetical protein
MWRLQSQLDVNVLDLWLIQQQAQIQVVCVEKSVVQIQFVM